MATVSRTVRIAAPAARVLDIVADVAGYPAIQPDLTAATVLERDDEGRPFLARLEFASMGLRGSYLVRFDHPGAGTVRYRMVEGDLMRRNDATFTVMERGSDACDLTVAVDLALSVPMPRPLLDRLAAKGVRDLLAGVRSRAERR